LRRVCRALPAISFTTLLGGLFWSSSACAEPSAQVPRQETASEPGAPTALLTGFAIAGASLGVSASLMAGDSELSTKYAGLFVLHSGLTLAPVAAHGVVGEWGRGAVFAIPPALGGLGMAALLAWHPQAPVVGKNKSHRIYPVCITLSVLGSALGIIDAALVDERAPVRVGAAASGDAGAAWIEGAF
jgi:hypothetical protein